jgi:GT2 family glycosyltransferase
MALSIIVVNWNTRGLLAGCLASVYAHPPKGKFEVFVVDNASTDGSVQLARESFPQVRLIENSENLGFARANNQAIRECTGRFVLLLNPDTEVQPGALETLIDFMDEQQAAGAAGARLVNPDGTLQPSCHPAPTLSRELWRLFHLDALHPYACYPMGRSDLETPHQVDVAGGACLVLRRDALRQVGLLDEDYFIFSEEVDLCHRLRQRGWEIFWVPQSVAMHHGGRSTQQVAAAMFLRLYQGKVLYFRKHHGRLAAQRYKLILLTAALARLLLCPLAWLERPPQRHQHLALADRYRRLVRALPGM